MIQHVSQLNVMLRALPKPVEVTEPTSIGFRLVQDLEQSRNMCERRSDSVLQMR